jgi:DnaJ-class molecular chaperone
MTDPYHVLGVTQTDGDATIRAAYLSAVRACPPERDPSRFEQVQAAYALIATQRDRLVYALFDTTAPGTEELIASLSTKFQPIVPDEKRLLKVLGAK